MVSLEQVHKIISDKVDYYSIDIARTKSVYLKFDENDQEFSLRISNHTKMDYDNNDFPPIEKEHWGGIVLNIFNNESKVLVLDYLKKYFENVKKIEKPAYSFKVEIKPKFSISESNKTLLLKYKIDVSKTKNQIKELILKKLISKKAKGVLIKKNYEKHRGMFKLVSTDEIKGIVTNIATTGGQATINNQTGKDFTLDNKEHQELLNLVKYNDF